MLALMNAPRDNTIASFQHANTTCQSHDLTDRKRANRPPTRRPRCPRSDSSVEKSEFEELLSWLGSDSDKAGREYELIRRKLIAMFRRKGCSCPEDLADATFNRVAGKLSIL